MENQRKNYYGYADSSMTALIEQLERRNQDTMELGPNDTRAPFTGVPRLLHKSQMQGMISSINSEPAYFFDEEDSKSWQQTHNLPGFEIGGIDPQLTGGTDLYIKYNGRMYHLQCLI